jgi:hypothetical protein
MTTRDCTADKATKLLEKFGWENLDHPPYSLHLAPSDFHLFAKNESFFGRKRMATDEVVTDCLKKFTTHFSDEGIVTLVQHLGICLNRNGTT